MFIQIENTPNPNVLKFLPAQAVSPAGNLEYLSADDAENSPLAQRLFAVPNVESVFFGADFVSVTKSEDQEWPSLKPLVLGAIMDHFQSGAPVLTDGETMATHASHDEADDEVVTQIKSLLDTRVRPAVAQDGGDIVFHGFDHGIVYLHMRGACAGCPSSTMTLKMGIENLLRHYIPEVVEVRPVA